MIRRLWGTCQGEEVTFSLAGERMWTATVPSRDDGYYILEIWAEDTAGNTGYFATVRLAFDPGSLLCKLQILSVGSLCPLDEVAELLGAEAVLSEAWPEDVRASVKEDMLHGEIIRFARCAR